MLDRSTRIKLAFISPLNPVPSGLADYSEALVPELSTLADLTLYSDCGVPSNPAIAERFTVRPVAHLARHRAEHDLRLYQIGNSSHHRTAFDNLRRLPGMVVLHEPFLHSGLLYTSPASYRRELFYDLGQADWSAAARYANLTAQDDREPLLAIPLIGRMLDSSLGIIVHSQAAKQIIQAYGRNRSRPAGSAAAEITVIPELMPALASMDPRQERSTWTWPPDAMTFGVAGTIHPSKEPHLVLQAFAQVIQSEPNARLVYMGDLPIDYGLPQLAQELGVSERILFTGHIGALDGLHRAMAACDVLINLRNPTIGETSGTALRALALGRPLIVRNVGWYSELPDTACHKIGASAGVNDLSAAMLALAQSSGLRQHMGQQARRYIETECAPSAIARRYLDVLWRVYERAIRSLEMEKLA